MRGEDILVRVKSLVWELHEYKEKIMTLQGKRIWGIRRLLIMEGKEGSCWYCWLGWLL